MLILENPSTHGGSIFRVQRSEFSFSLIRNVHLVGKVLIASLTKLILDLFVTCSYEKSVQHVRNEREWDVGLDLQRQVECGSSIIRHDRAHVFGPFDEAK